MYTKEIQVTSGISMVYHEKVLHKLTILYHAIENMLTKFRGE